MQKKPVTLLCMICSVMLLAACQGGPGSSPGQSSSPPGGQTPLVGISNASTSNTWGKAMWAMLKTELNRAKDENRIRDYIYADAQDSDIKQRSDIEGMLRSGIDILLVSPINAYTLNGTIEKAYDSGIPVVVFDRKCTTSKYTAYVTTDDIKNGELCASRMVALLSAANGSPKGDIVILEGWFGSGTQIERQQGMENILKNFPEIKVLGRMDCRFQREEGRKVMQEFLTQFPKVDGIISQSGESLCGAIQALDASGRQDCKLMAAMDAYNGVLKQIKTGRVGSTCLYPVSIGVEAYHAGMRIFSGETLDKELRLPNTEITRDNIDQYVKMESPDDVWTY
ncbi:MAG: substrate-binding domain-containing protein [Bacillota bacterium]|nr:substrate-binding domain-containing protein [Bacillota bacterium]